MYYHAVFLCWNFGCSIRGSCDVFFKEKPRPSSTSASFAAGTSFRSSCKLRSSQCLVFVSWWIRKKTQNQVPTWNKDEILEDNTQKLPAFGEWPLGLLQFNQLYRSLCQIFGTNPTELKFWKANFPHLHCIPHLQKCQPCLGLSRTKNVKMFKGIGILQLHQGSTSETCSTSASCSGFT